MNYNQYLSKHLEANIEGRGIIRPSINNLNEYLDTEDKAKGVDDSENEHLRNEKLHELRSSTRKLAFQKFNEWSLESYSQTGVKAPENSKQLASNNVIINDKASEFEKELKFRKLKLKNEKIKKINEVLNHQIYQDIQTSGLGSENTRIEERYVKELKMMKAKKSEEANLLNFKFLYFKQKHFKKRLEERRVNDGKIIRKKSNEEIKNRTIEYDNYVQKRLKSNLMKFLKKRYTMPEGVKLADAAT